MNWIKVTDRLPRIQEIVDVTNGYTIIEAWIWERSDCGLYFEHVEDDTFDIMPLWWRPKLGSALELAFEENTIKPRLEVK